MAATAEKVEKAPEKAIPESKEKDGGIVTATPPAGVPSEGSVTVTLYDIDNRYFSNYRTDVTEEHLQNLSKSLKTDGQLQNLCGTWIENDGRKMIGLFAGFCRLEAMHRNALARLVKEYNESKNLKPEDEGYIPLGGFRFESQAKREKLREAGTDWAEKYDNALKAYHVRTATSVVKDDVEAQLKNMIENEIREDASLFDKLNRIDALIDGGTTAKRIAEALKESEPAISQYRKLHDLPEFLRDMFKDTEAVKTALNLGTEEEAKEEQRILGLAVDEFVRRLSLPKNHDHVISFSHAREFSMAVIHKKEQLSLRSTALCLKELTRIKDNGEPSKEPVMDYGVFKLKLRDYISQARKLDANESVESLAQAQAEGAAAVVSTGNQPAATVTAPATTPILTSKIATGQTAEEAAKEAEMRAVGQVAGGAPSAEKDEALAALEQEVSSSGDDLESLAADDEALKAASEAVKAVSAPLAPGDEGKSRTKTAEAPEELRYKPRSPDAVERQAQGYLTDANDENTGHTQRAAMLLLAMQMYHVIGMADEEQKINKVYVPYVDAVENYYQQLEKIVKAKLPEEFAKLTPPKAEAVKV